MQFPSPLTIRLRNGQTITQSEFNVVLTDNSGRRYVAAQLLPVTKPLLLWSGDEYDAVGDYTQEQAESRLREVLGSDPASKLTTPHPSPTPTFPQRPAS